MAQLWLNDGSMMAQLWLNYGSVYGSTMAHLWLRLWLIYGSTMAQLWLNYGSFMAQIIKCCCYTPTVIEKPYSEVLRNFKTQRGKADLDF